MSVSLTVRLCMGGLTVLGSGSLPISFFSDSVKIMRFYDFARTSVSYHWFKFYIDVLWNEFLTIFLLHVPPVFALAAAVAKHSTQNVSAAHSCMRDVKWSLWDANDFCVVGVWDALQFCTFDLHTPGIAARIRLMTGRCRGPSRSLCSQHLEKNGENSAFETF